MQDETEGKFVPSYRLEIGRVLGTRETEYRHLNLEVPEDDPLGMPEFSGDDAPPGEG